MVGTDVEARNFQVWRLVRRQHGVVSRAQLLGMGLGKRSIEHRLRNGRLHRVAGGVYAVGRRDLSREGRWMAALLACGGLHPTGAAVLSHRSAAALWGIGTEAGRRLDVTVRRRANLRRPGIKVRTRPSLPASDLTTHHGIPVTTPIRTLIDVATELPEKRLERAVNEADKHDLVDPETLRAAP